MSRHSQATEAQIRASRELRQKREGGRQFRQDKARSYEGNPNPGSRMMGGEIRHSVNGKPGGSKTPY